MRYSISLSSAVGAAAPATRIRKGLLAEPLPGVQGTRYHVVARVASQMQLEARERGLLVAP